MIGYIPFFVRNYQYDQVSKTKDRIIEKGQGINAFGDVNLGLEFKIKTLENFGTFHQPLPWEFPVEENKGGTDGRLPGRVTESLINTCRSMQELHLI